MNGLFPYFSRHINKIGYLNFSSSNKNTWKKKKKTFQAFSVQLHFIGDHTAVHRKRDTSIIGYSGLMNFLALSPLLDGPLHKIYQAAF